MKSADAASKPFKKKKAMINNKTTNNKNSECAQWICSFSGIDLTDVALLTRRTIASVVLIL